MGQDEKSKLFANCIKKLYQKGKYTVEYAILQLEKFKDDGKIIASDYEEYLAFFVAEMEKENVTEVIEENAADINEEITIENIETA